jgi:hypothetical protein
MAYICSGEEAVTSSERWIELSLIFDGFSLARSSILTEMMETFPHAAEEVWEGLHVHPIPEILVGGAVVLAGIWAFRKMYQAAVG